MIYYIADLHLGHKNAIRHDGRPFDSVEEMNETIIMNWNDTVTPQDTVYVLDDVVWGGEKNRIDLIGQLCGRKHLILGNHDRLRGDDPLLWDSIAHYDEIIDTNTPVVLCHYPIMFYKNQFQGGVMLYGHVHNNETWQMVERWQQEKRDAGIPCRMINVGCMLPYIDYTPRTLEELLAATGEGV